MISVTTPPAPRKVLRLASQLGVHADCLSAEQHGGVPCAACENVMQQAFDFFYADLPSHDAVVAAIMDDFRQDIEDEG